MAQHDVLFFPDSVYKNCYVTLTVHFLDSKKTVSRCKVKKYSEESFNQKAEVGLIKMNLNIAIPHCYREKTKILAYTYVNFVHLFQSDQLLPEKILTHHG